MGLSSAYALVGNPRPGSRTASAASHLLDSLAGDLPRQVLDLSGHGPAVLDPQATAVQEDVAALSQASLLLVVSPVYKGSYTGLLKSFLDRVPPGGLTGVVAVPVMVGASAAHADSAEVHLRPVLLELGATCPTPGLYLQEQTLAAIGTGHPAGAALDDPVADPVAAWCTEYGWLIAAALAGAPVPV